MKTTQILSTVMLIMFLACDKEDDICVKTSSFDSGIETLTRTDYAKAESFFIKNNLNFENKQFTRLSENDHDDIIDCYQYINGLKIFTDPLRYFFRKSDQRLDFLLGDTLLQVSIIPGTTSQLKRDTVFSIYKSTIEGDEAIRWNNSLCYVVEFGYYDLNVSTNLDPVYVPAWRVKPENSYTPEAYINDTTKELIYYFNGIYQ